MLAGPRLRGANGERPSQAGRAAGRAAGRSVPSRSARGMNDASLVDFAA